MKWLELSVEAPAEFVEPLSEVFHRYGTGGVAVEQRGGYNPDEGEIPPRDAVSTVSTYIPLDSTAEQRRNQIDLGVRLVAYLSPNSVLRERVLEEEDWENAWKEHFQVLRIGRRIVVVPTWREYDPKESDVVIGLDPGMAFGTGHHPTTRMCLELLEEHVSPGVAVLDVGSGSGILGIASVMLGAARVYGLEIESDAASVGRSNLKENGVSDIAKISQGTLPHPDVAANSYDLVVANISARVISEMAAELVKATRPGGKLILSGVLADLADEVSGRVEDAGAVVRSTRMIEDWVSLMAEAS